MDKIDEWFKRAFDKDPSKPIPNPQSGEDRKGSTNSEKSGKSDKKRYGGKKRNDKRHNNPQKAKKPQNPQVQQKPSSKPTPIIRGKIKIIPLGGLNEVGKNMMAVEYEEDIIIIDMGFEFPSDDLLGIDYVIPDVSYLEDNKKRIRGVVLTHGHLDHIGGIPYILPRLDFPPVYGAKLTMGLVEHRIKEFKQEKQAKLFAVDPDKPLKLGKILVNFFRVMHSIPDSLGIVIETPVGKIVHTGDFKFDEFPARNMVPADIHKMEALGKDNVLALFCESTNSLKPGHTISEKEVELGLEEAISQAKGRVILASFSSQIGRVQQILDAAANVGRKVYVSGRSMINNISIAHKLGYLAVEKGTIFDIKKYKPKENQDAKTLILTTGSQGEPFAALARIARKDHSHISLQKGDTVVLSSSPIPGNEIAINTIINQLCILGATVINNQMLDIHTSGHAKQEELKRMINYIKPQYLIPIHGEYYMRQGLGVLANKECGIQEDRIIMLQNGDVLLGEKGKVYKSKETVETKYILIDGSGEGQMGSQVLVDRQIMSKNGALIVLLYTTKKGSLKGTPDVVSRGFIYMHESEAITKDIIKIAKESYENIRKKNPGANRKDIKRYIRQSVDKYTYKNLERSPLIIPLIIES